MYRRSKFVVMAMAVSMLTTQAVTTAVAPLAVYAATKLDTPDNLGWDDDNECIAIWDEVENAKQYEVYLYKESDDSDSYSKVAEIKTKKAKYNFKKKMTSEGSYSFRVKALSSKSSGDSSWSDYSDSTWVSKSRASFNDSKGNQDTSASGPGVTKTQETAAQSENQMNNSGAFIQASNYVYGWQQDANGWWWKNDDGSSYPVNCWRWLDGNKDGVAECYYFNAYGYMLANTTTPDGYFVNADGAWAEPNGAVHTMQSR